MSLLIVACIYEFCAVTISILHYKKAVNFQSIKKCRGKRINIIKYLQNNTAGASNKSFYALITADDIFSILSYL